MNRALCAGHNLVRMVSTKAPGTENDRLDAALRRKESAFHRLVESHRAEFHAHCYRMLGSLHDAEDALQDALLRAWRGLPNFDGRSSLRTWLYRIATNACLDILARRPKRVLPLDYGPPTDPHDGPGRPLTESVWVEPYPDERLGVEDGYAGPEARYEQRESVELAFIAALQHLPPNQRAVLIVRDGLGFSAKEAAETLDTTTASVNSALQRARKTVDDRLPDQSQQETMRALGDERVREIVQSYVDAWQRADVPAVVEMLTEDAAFAMPPLGTWFSGRDGIETFLAGSPLSGRWRWRPIPTQANGQPALAYYSWDEDEGAYLPFALNVLSLRGEQISEVTAFITRAAPSADREVVARMPEHSFDPDALAAAFQNFGLPERLE